MNSEATIMADFSFGSLEVTMVMADDEGKVWSKEDANRWCIIGNGISAPLCSLNMPAICCKLPFVS